MDASILLKQWQTGLRIRHEAHHKMAARHEKLGRWLTVPSAVLAAAVGTSIFSGLESDGFGRTIAGMISLLIVVLASLQSALNCPALAANHRSAALQYGALRRRLETQLAIGALADPKAAAAFLDSFQQEWTKLDEQAPTITQSLYSRIAARSAKTDERLKAIIAEDASILIPS